MFTGVDICLLWLVVSIWSSCGLHWRWENSTIQAGLLTAVIIELITCTMLRVCIEGCSALFAGCCSLSPTQLEGEAGWPQNDCGHGG